MSLVDRFLSKVVVIACESCEGASGAVYNASTGTISVCRACQGTGEARKSGGAAIHVLRPRKAGRDVRRAA